MRCITVFAVSKRMSKVKLVLKINSRVPGALGKEIFAIYLAFLLQNVQVPKIFEHCY